MRVIAAMVAATGTLVLVCAAQAQTSDPTPAELKCEAAVSQAYGKAGDTYAKCAAKCWFASPAPTCFGDPCFQSAADKFGSTEATKCSADCPEAYIQEDGSCAGIGASALGRELLGGFLPNAVDSLPLVLCDDSGSGDGLTKLEQLCQAKLAKAAGKLGKSLTKCAAKCQLAAAKGETDGDCGGIGATDSLTVACRTTAETKATASIQKACYDPGTDTPECFTGTASNAAQWVTGIEATADAVYWLTFGDPPCPNGLRRLGPACWRIGNLGQSCSDVCGALGFNEDYPTTTYAGSGGNDARCKAVISAAGALPGNLPFTSTNCDVADECMVAEASGDRQWVRCQDTPADPNASNAVHRRVCACSSAMPCQAIVGGFCWYQGALGADCDATCAANGRVYDEATRTFAGSDGTDDNCAAVLSALLSPLPFEDTSSGGLGCAISLFPFGGLRDTDPTTSSSASSLVGRPCACR